MLKIPFLFVIIFSMKTLIIIPTYNEDQNIIDLVNEVKKKNSDMDYLVINDGSTDRTKQLLKLNDVKHMNLPINLGLNYASRVGFEYAYENNYDYAIKIDGDGQHNPSAINYMLKTMKNANVDIVQMSRFKTKKRKVFSLRMLGSRMISICAWIVSGTYLTDPTNGCHLYNRKILKEYYFDKNLGPEPNTLIFLIRNKYKFKDVQYKIRPRKTGVSKFSSISHTIMYMLEICITILFVLPFRPKSKIVRNKKRKKVSK